MSQLTWNIAGNTRWTWRSRVSHSAACAQQELTPFRQTRPERGCLYNLFGTTHLCGVARVFLCRRRLFLCIREVRALCVSHGTRRNDVEIGVNLAPFMIHELLLFLTETASGSHPCCVVSVTYHRPSYFHGGNTGSNPVGDAKHRTRFLRPIIYLGFTSGYVR
jgi:hypothetical protein